DNWMHDAFADLMKGNVASALQAYDGKGRLIGCDTRGDAMAHMIADWHDGAGGDTFMVAHLDRDVRLLNGMARERLLARGEIGEGFAFQTERGMRDFSAGDSVVFLKAEASLGLKGGLRGKVSEASADRLVISVADENGSRQVVVDHPTCGGLEHGYAMTIQRSQGMHAGRVKVL